jgi:catechol 2,3-dioxygenase-like lactoylglutathione lyase family enzyme
MIGYITLGTNDLDRARAFWSELLGTIGATEMIRMEEGFTLYGVGWDKPGIAVTPPYEGEHDRGNGQMAAIVVDTRDKVDAFHAKALALGGSDEGPVGLRGDEGPMAFYAGYFRDLDGNKACVYRLGPA